MARASASGLESPERLDPRSGSHDRGAVAAERLLGLHEEVSDPSPCGCPRWPVSLRLESSDGRLVWGRCNSPNLCEYCARLAAVEISEMLALDALEGSAPAVWCVLGTAMVTTDMARFYRSREQVWKAVKRRWPDAEYVALVEYTSGYGPKSGGKRRPHWNLLIKGVPAEALDELDPLVRRVWCSREDAEPDAQFVGPVSEVGGLMRYLALHFLKESQAPPVGWHGHRTTKSRGYFTRPVAEVRADARRALRLKRELWRALQTVAAAIPEGAIRADLVEDVALGRLDASEALTWRLVAVHEHPGGVMEVREIERRRADDAGAPPGGGVRPSAHTSPARIGRDGRLLDAQTGEVLLDLRDRPNRERRGWHPASDPPTEPRTKEAA